LPLLAIFILYFRQFWQCDSFVLFFILLLSLLYTESNDGRRRRSRKLTLFNTINPWSSVGFILLCCLCFFYYLFRIMIMIACLSVDFGCHMILHQLFKQYIIFINCFFQGCKGDIFPLTGQALNRGEDHVGHEVKLPPYIQFPFGGSRYNSLYVSFTWISLSKYVSHDVEINHW
jgi:hypothetical protein